MKIKRIVHVILVLTLFGCTNDRVMSIDKHKESLKIKVFDENDLLYHNAEILIQDRTILYNDTIFLGLNVLYKNDTLNLGYFHWNKGEFFKLYAFYNDEIPNINLIPENIFEEDLSKLSYNVKKVFDIKQSNYKPIGNLSTLNISDLGEIYPSNPFEGIFLNYKIKNLLFEDYIEINLTNNLKIKNITFLELKKSDSLRI
jgi:hypothetical protein